MANLNFKMGEFKNLLSAANKANATTAGTVYVTTDEKAIYVDVPTLDAEQNITGANRIRLGQIIIWSESEWAAAQPPYSTEAFYYVTGANALLRWNGANWTQINSTSDVQNNINVLNTLLSYKGAYDQHPQDLLVGDIYYNTTDEVYYRKKSDSKWALYQGIGKEISRIDDLASDITIIKTDYAKIGNTTDKTDALTLHGVKNYATGILGQNENGEDFNGTVKGAYEEIAKAKTAILGEIIDQESGKPKDFDGTVKGAYDKAAANATDIQTLFSNLQVADALVYKGIVDSETKLSEIESTGQIKKGYTYKATKAFTLRASKASTNTAIDIYIGDLLIATGTENSETGYIGEDLKWDHIPSGYVADYNPGMSIDTVSSNGTSINLTSAATTTNGDLGKIQLKGSDNIKLDSVIKDGTSSAIGVQFNLVWGTF